MRTRFIAGLLLGAFLAAAGLGAWRWARRARAEWALAPRMHAFIQALTKPPRNADPAAQWKPLVRGEVRCATCHEDGDRMQERIDEEGLPPAGRSTDDHERMVALMEKWVRQLNRKADHLLDKAVVCLDCHESDPRR